MVPSYAHHQRTLRGSIFYFRLDIYNCSLFEQVFYYGRVSIFASAVKRSLPSKLLVDCVIWIVVGSQIPSWIFPQEGIQGLWFPPLVDQFEKLRLKRHVFEFCILVHWVKIALPLFDQRAYSVYFLVHCSIWVERPDFSSFHVVYASKYNGESLPMFPLLFTFLGLWFSKDQSRFQQSVRRNSNIWFERPLPNQVINRLIQIVAHINVALNLCCCGLIAIWKYMK